MAATLVPQRGKQIDPLPVGASVVYRFIYTAIVGPDPATWSTIRFSICENEGIDSAYFTVTQASMTTTAGGSAGAYTMTIDVPVTEANSRLITDTGIRWYQLDFVSSGGYQDILEDGTVEVYAPSNTLP